jgi:hypothetical protein
MTFGKLSHGFSILNVRINVHLYLSTFPAKCYRSPCSIHRDAASLR